MDFLSIREIRVEETIEINAADGNSCLTLVPRVFGGDNADSEGRQGAFFGGIRRNGLILDLHIRNSRLT